jgi:hypothetical protein
MLLIHLRETLHECNPHVQEHLGSVVFTSAHRLLRVGRRDCSCLDNAGFLAHM